MLTRAFLGLDSLSEGDEWTLGKASIRRWIKGDRTVFHTWALNGGALAFSGAPHEYIDRLSDLIAGTMQ